MKIVFMGTSQFAVPSLRKLFESKHEIVGVITQPDRPRGRGKKLQPSPVKELAQQFAVEIFQPEKIRAEKAINHLREWEIDLIVVASYGQIIPVEILDYPRLGCINVHTSLLPRYRGAAPLQRAIMAGDKVTGISIMFMDEGLDTGDIIMQVPVKINEQMDHGALEVIMAEKGADLLIDTIAVLQSGSLPRRKQDPNQATYAARLVREEEKVVWEQDCTTIFNHIRAMSPAPGCYTLAGADRFKIFKSRIVDKEKAGDIGKIISITEEGIEVQTGQGTIEVLEVQKVGKKRMSTREFLKGFRLKPGDYLT